MDDDRSEQQPSTSKSAETSTSAESNRQKKPRSSGVIYLAAIPYHMTSNRLRDMLCVYGKIGRIYLAPDKSRNDEGKKRRAYSEGWIEFASKSVAKRVAMSLNNTPVGGKKRSKAAECLWTMKYLHGFKWVHLTEQLNFERAVHQQRMQAEATHAKRQANFFASQVEKGAKLAALEERVLKKGGRWEQYQRQIAQKQPAQPKEKNKKDTDKIMSLIFAE